MPGFVLGTSSFRQTAPVSAATEITLSGGLPSANPDATPLRHRRVVRAVDVSTIWSKGGGSPINAVVRLKYEVPIHKMNITNQVTLVQNSTHRFDGPFTTYSITSGGASALLGECVSGLATWSLFSTDIFPSLMWQVHWADVTLDEGAQEFFRYTTS